MDRFAHVIRTPIARDTIQIDSKNTTELFFAIDGFAYHSIGDPGRVLRAKLKAEVTLTFDEQEASGSVYIWASNAWKPVAKMSARQLLRRKLSVDIEHIEPDFEPLSKLWGSLSFAIDQHRPQCCPLLRIVKRSTYAPFRCAKQNDAAG